MLAYAVRRLLLIVPTLFGILALNFAIVQVAPGGPVETMIARLSGTGGDPTARASGDRGGDVAERRGAPDTGGAPSRYRGARGLDPRLIQELEKLYGFDQPAHVRFWKMVKSYAVFDFGQSFFRDRPVLALMVEKMPVSISLGLWSTLVIYLVSIPLGVAKAVRDGSPFDVWTSTAVIVGYAIPGFLVRHPAHRGLRGRELSRVVPAARPRLRQLARAVLARAPPRLRLAHGAARHRRSSSAASRASPCSPRTPSSRSSASSTS